MEILKTFWQQRQDGVYGAIAMQSLDLLGPDRKGADFFPVQDDVVVTQHTPIAGTIKSVMGESIVPVVAIVPGENKVRCVGTAFFISCTGLLITAAHVITDPIDRKYGNVKKGDDASLQARDIYFGVLVPNNPLFQIPGYSFFQFEWSMFLAQQRSVPLTFMGLDLKLTSDIAICKVPEKAGNYPHQPLAIVQSGIVGTGMGVGSYACALGYAGMADFDIDLNSARQITAHKKFNLHGSTGKLIEFFPNNFEKQTVMTPGPCFSFGAEIPGGMSGGPIFDREGIYVHGVISSGCKDESGPERFSYGSMLRPSMGLPIARMNGASLDDLQKRSSEGMAVLRASGL
jgi:S1-C subfamily serine protease